MSHDEVRIPYGSKRPLLVAAIIGYLEKCPGHSIRRTAIFASEECHTSEAWARFTLYDLERSGLVSINMCRRGAACFLTNPGETCLGVVPE